MDIDESQPLAHEPVPLDEPQQFLVRNFVGGGQGLEESQDFRAVPQVPARQFADDEGMADGHCFGEQPGQGRVAQPQMVNPDRGVDEDHGRWRSAPPRDRAEPLLRAAESGQALAAFGGDEGMQAQTHKRGFLRDARESGGPREYLVVDVQGSPHMHEDASTMHIRQEPQKEKTGRNEGSSTCRHAHLRAGMALPSLEDPGNPSKFQSDFSILTIFIIMAIFQPWRNDLRTTILRMSSGW